MKMFFSADHDVDLWPHFYKHYTALGATEFYCSGTNCPLKTQDNLTVVPHILDTSIPYFRSLQRAFFKMIDETPMESNEWWMLAELDEFHDYEGEVVPDIIKKCNEQNKNCVRGVLIDRVASDGSLPDLKQDVPIEEQFPKVSNITAEIANFCLDKIMLVRGRQVVHGGNHSIQNQVNYEKRFKVNHFKWHSNILKRMNERVALGNDEGHGWIQGNKRLLKRWEANKSVLI